MRGDMTMKVNKMWAYLIHLGANMWGEPGSIKTNAPFHDYVITEDHIWTKVIDALPSFGFNTVVIDIGDAMEYETHPEISIKGAWSKDKLRNELKRIRDLGLTPLPKLNFAARHDAWLKEYSRMVSTPQYYKVCEDLIREVAEVFDYPEYFHLGMDEEWDTVNQGDNMIIVRPHRVWWHDVNFLFNVCDSIGARPWVWADPCWDNKDEYVKNMSKSAVQSNWYYGTVRKNPDGTYQRKEIQTFCTLEEAGFDQVPAFSTCGGTYYNPQHIMQAGKDVIAPDRLLGFLSCPWFFTNDRFYYALLSEANHFKYSKEMVFPEVGL